MTHEYRRSSRCQCHKVRYRDEAAALTAAGNASARAGLPIAAYLCPGSNSWHITSRGFRPSSLRSRARILAWHLDKCGSAMIGDLAQISDLRIDTDPNGRAMKRLRQLLRSFEVLGLITRDGTAGVKDSQCVYAADRDGLRRVMSVGLEEYARGRGVSVAHGRVALPGLPNAGGTRTAQDNGREAADHGR